MKGLEQLDMRSDGQGFDTIDIYSEQRDTPLRYTFLNMWADGKAQENF